MHWPQTHDSGLGQSLSASQSAGTCASARHTPSRSTLGSRRWPPTQN
ncbi:MAG: hypothetical protein IPH72_04110 [Sandaracinaceae bacterium]|nr:hypothetical protein [Sandaracinaceae bacterium]